MWVLIAVAGLGSMAVLAIGATLGAGRRYEGQHVLDDVQAEYDAWVAGQGSMILAEEHPLEPLPAPTVDPEPWRRQVEHDLAPDALEETHEEIVLPAYGGWISGPCLDPDPGPGGGEASSLVPPGPEQSEWLATQMALLYVWVRSCYEVTP